MCNNKKNWTENGLHKILDSDSKIVISLIIIHQIFSLAHDWIKHVKWLNISQLKLGNIRVIFPSFQNRAFCENKRNSLHLTREYARIFALGHYLFLKAHSYALGTDNVRGQISEQIFAPNGGYCLSILVFLTSNTVFVHYKTNTVWTNEGKISWNKESYEKLAFTCICCTFYTLPMQVYSL